MLNPGDVKLSPPFQPMLIATSNGSTPGWRIYFSIRGQGNYYVDVPQSWTAQQQIAAVTAEATKICDVMDGFR